MLRKHPERTETELNFISLFWPRLPSGIQAAYENVETDEITIFKGNLIRRSPLFLTFYFLLLINYAVTEVKVFLRKLNR